MSHTFSIFEIAKLYRDVLFNCNLCYLEYLKYVFYIVEKCAIKIMILKREMIVITFYFYVRKYIPIRYLNNYFYFIFFCKFNSK